jgi:hypothetical protein
MNPLKSYVLHALEDADPEPGTDRPRLRTQQAMGGGLVLYEPRADEADAWIHGDDRTLVDLKEVA